MLNFDADFILKILLCASHCLIGPFNVLILCVDGGFQVEAIASQKPKKSKRIGRKAKWKDL